MGQKAERLQLGDEREEKKRIPVDGD